MKKILSISLFIFLITSVSAVDLDGDGCHWNSCSIYQRCDCDDTDSSICDYADVNLYFDLDDDGYYAKLPSQRHLNDDFCHEHSFQ
ncbi:MAG: hypothetical protein ABIJ08_04640, partial [Nanoarchaeota archaeon]